MKHDKLKQLFAEAGLTNIVTLGDWIQKIGVLLKVNVRVCEDRDYDEISINDIDDDGTVNIKSTEVKPANTSAIQRQRLHEGDLLFGHRGKMGKVGVLKEEHYRPLVGNHGMMRISFKEERSIETSKYVQDYLQSTLISSYITAMMPNKQITAELIRSLPIPDFDEMEGMSKFSTIKNKRHKLEIQAKQIWEKCRDRKAETLMLSSMSNEKLSSENEIDNHLLSELQSLSTKLQVTIPSSQNIFLQIYTEL